MESSSNEKGFVILPNDELPPQYTVEKSSKKLITLKDGALFSSVGGVLIREPYYPWKYTIQTNSSCYDPVVGDYIVGIISQTFSDTYMVDINASFEASLQPVDAFEGATKQWRPSLSVGCVVYCVVQEAHKDYETELTCRCVDDSKHWNTNEAYFGELKGGCVFTVPIAVARSLLGDRSFVLERLGKSLCFEISIGMNGRIWVKTEKTVDTIIVMNTIKHMVGLTLPQMEVLCRKLLNDA